MGTFDTLNAMNFGRAMGRAGADLAEAMANRSQRQPRLYDADEVDRVIEGWRAENEQLKRDNEELYLGYLSMVGAATEARFRAVARKRALKEMSLVGRIFSEAETASIEERHLRAVMKKYGDAVPSINKGAEAREKLVAKGKVSAQLPPIVVEMKS